DRIGANHLPRRQGDLNVLDWFLKLAQTNFKASSPAETLSKREEFAALERGFELQLNPYLPSTGDVYLLSAMVSNTFKDLIEDGWVEIGPIYTFVRIDLPRLSEPGIPKTTSKPSAAVTKQIGGNGLHNEMAFLLKKYAASVARCPRPCCNKIFVQPRKNARYCSRSCQNAHYMQLARGSRQQNTIQRKRPSEKAKKGHDHGKKRR
ncbi:MAG: hypothetical protein ABI988_19565, partial [Nitrospirota bacterium]